MLLNKLAKSLEPLKQISKELSEVYGSHRLELLSHVNGELESHPRCHELIGYQPLQFMKRNHANHFHYIRAVLRYGLYDSLLVTVPWVLQAYASSGFLPEYYDHQLSAWRSGLQKLLPAPQADSVDLLYRWMQEHLDELFELAEHDLGPPSASPQVEAFFQSSISGDLAAVMRQAQDAVDSPEALQSFYMDVLAPSLHRVGEGWARGQLTVAQEHMASALASRVMGVLYGQYVLRTPEFGKLFVTSVSRELHEFGPRMVADLFTIQGWDVSFLGANTPAQELPELLEQSKCEVLCISATMIYHLPQVEEMIRAVRARPALAQLKIMVGGQAFQGLGPIWKQLGADAFAHDAKQAVQLASSWLP